MVRHARRSRTPAGRSTDRKTHAMTEEPLHPRRDLTNDELVRYLESEPVTIPRPRSDSSPLSSRRYLLGMPPAARFDTQSFAWHGSAFCAELLSAVGGYGPEGTEGRPPYPTGHKSETQRLRARAITNGKQRTQQSTGTDDRTSHSVARMSGGQRSDVAKLLQRRNDGTKLREKRD